MELYNKAWDSWGCGLAEDTSAEVVPAGSLAEAVVLAALTPWRILPRLRNMHLEVLIALFLAAILADLVILLAIHLPLLPPRAILLASMRHLATSLAILATGMAVCGAAPGRSIGDTLGNGFKCGLLLSVSLAGWGLVAGTVVSQWAAGPWVWLGSGLVGGLRLYTLIAAGVSMVRLAHREAQERYRERLRQDDDDIPTRYVRRARWELKAAEWAEYAHSSRADRFLQREEMMRAS